jgi:3-dehydroquinate dehydratase
MEKRSDDHNHCGLIALNFEFLEVAMLPDAARGSIHDYLRRSIAKSLCIVNAGAFTHLKCY